MAEDNPNPDPPAMAAPISATPDEAGNQATVSATTNTGILFMEIYDEQGVNPLAGKSYRIVAVTGGKTYSGTLDKDGRLRHEGVPPDDYVITVDGVTETGAALVLDQRDEAPQIRFLSGGE
jgi:hypothetical protein